MLKLFQESGESTRRAVEGVNPSMIYLIHFKTIVNATMYTYPTQFF
jgi:hypothetical protein